MTYAAAADRGREAAGGWASDAPPGTNAAPAGGTVLLGGAGLLGSRLAASLLREPGDAPVTIVSRRPGEIRARWAGWLGDNEASRFAASPRLRLIAADLSGPDLGWMAAIPRSGAVFHLAALVHAFDGWGKLSPTNIGSLRHAAALARRDSALLQIASTLSLAVSSNWNDCDHEALPPASADFWLYGGYAQTKVAAEFALLEAAGDLRWQIVRYGLLVPEGGSLFSPDHFAPSLASAIDEVGALPAEAEEAEVDLTPVDGAGEAAMRIAVSGELGVFHWANPEGARLSAFVAALEVERAARGGAPLPVVPVADWEARLATLPGLKRALLRSAFRKSDFLAREAARGPILNADLFQATGRHFGIGRALAVGCAHPPAPTRLLPWIAAAALGPRQEPRRSDAASAALCAVA